MLVAAMPCCFHPPECLKPPGDVQWCHGHFALRSSQRSRCPAWKPDLQHMTNNGEGNLTAMASNLRAMASNLEAMASNLRAMASNLLAMVSNQLAMVSNLLAMASTKKHVVFLTALLREAAQKGVFLKKHAWVLSPDI